MHIGTSIFSHHLNKTTFAGQKYITKICNIKRIPTCTIIQILNIYDHMPRGFSSCYTYLMNKRKISNKNKNVVSCTNYAMARLIQWLWIIHFRVIWVEKSVLHIYARTKLPSFSRLYFQMHFSSIQISFKFLPRGPINNKSALVGVMAWCRTAKKPWCKTMLTQIWITIWLHSELIQWMIILKSY